MAVVVPDQFRGGVAAVRHHLSVFAEARAVACGEAVAVVVGCHAAAAEGSVVTPEEHAAAVGAALRAFTTGLYRTYVAAAGEAALVMQRRRAAVMAEVDLLVLRGHPQLAEFERYLGEFYDDGSTG